MVAERLMESKSYVTFLCTVPFNLHKSRVGLVAILERLNLLLEDHWGSEEPGTVAQEHHTAGPTGRVRKAKRSSQTRFKFGKGLDVRD